MQVFRSSIINNRLTTVKLSGIALNQSFCFCLRAEIVDICCFLFARDIGVYIYFIKDDVNVNCFNINCFNMNEFLY